MKIIEKPDGLNKKVTTLASNKSGSIYQIIAYLNNSELGIVYAPSADRQLQEQLKTAFLSRVSGDDNRALFSNINSYHGRYGTGNDAIMATNVKDERHSNSLPRQALAVSTADDRNLVENIVPLPAHMPMSPLSDDARYVALSATKIKQVEMQTIESLQTRNDHATDIQPRQTQTKAKRSRRHRCSSTSSMQSKHAITFRSFSDDISSIAPSDAGGTSELPIGIGLSDGERGLTIHTSSYNLQNIKLNRNRTFSRRMSGPHSA